MPRNVRIRLQHIPILLSVSRVLLLLLNALALLCLALVLAFLILMMVLTEPRTVSIRDRLVIWARPTLCCPLRHVLIIRGVPCILLGVFRVTMWLLLTVSIWLDNVAIRLTPRLINRTARFRVPRHRSR